MTREEAFALMLSEDGACHPDRLPTVTVTRSGDAWTGQVVGVVDQPSLIIETPTGRRVAVALEGTEVVDAPF